VIVIRGNDITVDFAGATLQGADTLANPDAAVGVAILVDGGERVQVRNARVRGYRIGLLGRDTRGLSLIDNDLSHNWKPRLFSVLEHESLVDWLSFHKNESREWMRYGAGIYLSGVFGGELRGNRIEQGMNGVLLVRCDSIRVWNNTIAFNSGVGIGLYRSSSNTIVHNHASYNVRGYSHGFYRRGQDSADLLLYEQSSNNVIAFNSMTHGGDGLFLWAGQSTMDTGQGGSNDNMVFANDFSWAVANAMEATFSRNTFVANLAQGSEYGLWGGYSYETKVLGNDFRANRFGVAIEHGQNNTIGANRFAEDSVAIQLWANPTQPADWAYPKQRDTRSRDYRIDTNVMYGNRIAVRVTNSTGVSIVRNQLLDVDTAFVLRDVAQVTLSVNDTTGMRDRLDELPPLPAHRTLDPMLVLPRPIPGGFAAQDDTLGQRSRAAIVVDEWGPYDWRSPKLWPLRDAHASPLALRVLGPPGVWRVVGRRGIASLSRDSGAVNDTIVVTPAAGAERDWEITLEYRGARTVSPRGEARAAGEPYRFSYSYFQPIAGWSVSFFGWTSTADPRTQAAAFANVLRGAPLATQRAPRLDYLWSSRPAVQGVPPTQWAAVATTTVTLGPGEYTLRSISDDGTRVWVDGRLAIDNWTPHESVVDTAPIAAGRHELRVEYYQVDGWTELRVEVVRGVQRSRGSAGLK
jgi:parallel beta-helix repeat protein